MHHFVSRFAGALVASWVLASSSVLAGPIEDLQPGNWLEIPNSKLRAVLPSPLPTGNPYMIMAAWSGGAYDTKRNRLIVWGGGHNDYCGNELYVFDVPGMRWIRLTDPTSSPLSIHSYDQLEYLPEQDRFFAAGGSVCSSGGWATDDTLYFNFDTNSWEQRAALPGALGDFWELAMDSDYDPVSKRVVLVGYKESGDYDPATNRWTRHGNDFFRNLGHSGALDPEKRKYITIGEGTPQVFDMDANGRLGARRSLVTTGAKDLENSTAPGLVYDPTIKKIVGWANGGDVFSLDMGTLVWTRHSPANSINPGNPRNQGDYHGTFGRFRYMPAYNAYIVATTIDSNVFVYKLSPGAGNPGPTITFNASPTSVSSGQTSVLTWSTTNAANCTASGGWSGAKATSGNETVGPLTATTTYTLSCSTSGGASSSSSATVTLAANPAPTVTFSASPGSVALNGSSTLNWTSSNATSCTGSAGLAGWPGTKPLQGSANVGPFVNTTGFTLACTGSGGTTQRNATVTVAPLPTITLSAAPTTVNSGQSSTLTWSSQNATTCTASGAWSGSKATSGSQTTGALTATSNYRLDCTGGGGTDGRNVTVTVNGAPPPPPAPTVTLSANPTSVTTNGTSSLTWSSTNATACTASGGWTGTRGTSGTESVGPLANTQTFTLACTGTGGSANQSATVTVTAGGGGGGGSTPSTSGGGAFDPRSLLALLLLLAGTRGNSIRRFAPRMATALSTLMLALITPALTVAATPDEDWQARRTAPGVVRAYGFDTMSEYTNCLWDADQRDNAWDQSVKASGAGAFRFDIKSRSGEGSGGNCVINFSPDLSVQFGANEEFWIQWRQRFDAFVISHDYRNTDGSGEWKQVIIAQGDTPAVKANACTEAELVIQNQGNRDYPSGYIECTAYDNFEEFLGGSTITRQNQRRTPSGQTACQWWPTGGNISGCLGYHPNEWMTFMVHVQMGPDGVGPSSVSSDPSKRGFINSTIEFYVGREGQPVLLAHRQTGVVIPRGQWWNASRGINPDVPGDPGYSSGWGPKDAHPFAKYGKIWLLPYNTFKDPSEVHQDASIWYDEVIISRQRIPDPGAVSNPNQPTVSLSANPTSVQTNGSSTLTWSSTNATSCTASGGWSGTKATSGTQSTGALTATTGYTLVCSDGNGNSATASATVTVTGTTPAPTVTLNANPTSIPLNGSTSLTWSSTNATSCNASGGTGGWAGTKATSGSQTINGITAAATFTLACTGAGGTTQRNASVQIQAGPSITFNANPTTVAPGASSTLTWAAQNATGCTASGAWAGNKATSGSEQTAALSQTSQYVLDCTGAGGTTSRSVTVQVSAAPPPPAATVTLAANPTTVAVNATTTLTWSTTNAASCAASGAWSGTQTTSGTWTSGALSNNATYTLTCNNSAGTPASSSVNVTVQAGGGGGSGPGESGGGSAGWLLLAGLALARALRQRASA